MGWEGVTLRVSASLNAHAGDKEIRDAVLWKEFVQEVKKLADEKLHVLTYWDVDATGVDNSWAD